MITDFNHFITDAKTNLWYRGFEIKKNLDKSPGEDGLWFIPELYYRNFANKIVKNFETVSIIQSKEAIDEWIKFNIEVKKYKD